ncbi:MAG: hypothetical protein L0Z62_05465 [Gemmataceae bacterium]|nr:hypothetical protein [Gemmataceae bacterium]
MADNSSETDRLLRQAADGNPQSWKALLARHEEKLRRVVALRMDSRLQGRIDPSDVLQETYLEAAQHLATYLRESPMSFYLWLRGIAGNKLLELHRHPLGTQLRDAGRLGGSFRQGGRTAVP